MDKIVRKSMLYKTGVEYGDYTMNHVLGCSHGCLYPCYAYLMARRFGKVNNYESWCSPKLVENTLELLDKEIPKLKSKISSVQLCFTTDPFMNGFDEVKEMSIKAIEKLNSYDIPCTILTKGILPQELAKLSYKNEYGITLVSLNENFREQYEPGATSYEARISALKKLSKKGLKTWVSVEPYPTPNIVQQDIVKLLNKISFVNKIIFGRSNYSKNATSFSGHKDFYNEQANLVIDYCQKNKIDYYIKNKTITL